MVIAKKLKENRGQQIQTLSSDLYHIRTPAVSQLHSGPIDNQQK